MNPLKKILQFTVAMLFIMHGSASAQFNPPEKLAYQAVVRNSAGGIVKNQNVKMRFTIHTGTILGASEYMETQSLTTNQFGLITTAIGSGTVVLGTWNSITWSGDKKYLQVEMDISGGTAFTEMGTSEMVSVPYALYSKTAATSLDNHWAANLSDIYSVNSSGKVGIGTVLPAFKLDVRDDATSPNVGIVHVRNTSSNTYDTYAVYGESAPADYYGIGGYFVGGFKGVAGKVQPTGSSTYYGVYGDVSGGTGSNYGVYGTGDQIGTYGTSAGPGIGITQTDFTNSEVAGVVGTAYNTSSAGEAYGVIGQAIGSSVYENIGVYGEAGKYFGGNTSSYNKGIEGEAYFGSVNVGVRGAVEGASGSDSRGVEGYCSGGGWMAAIYGWDSGNSGTHYAGYFAGDLYAYSANSSIKAFKIDHPLDPANKYLYHSSVESNEMLDIYSGNITTDASGFAKIVLPSYFEALNKDFRYQLTCMGVFAQAMVYEKIKDNSFTIKTNQPSVEVSWQVSGVRHDPVAEFHRIVPEVEKSALEKGKYLIPEAYGQDSSKAMMQPSHYLPQSKKQNVK